MFYTNASCFDSSPNYPSDVLVLKIARITRQLENKLSSNNFTSSMGWNVTVFHKIWRNVINIPRLQIMETQHLFFSDIWEIVKFAFPDDTFITNIKKRTSFLKKNLPPERVHYSIRNIGCVKTSSLLKSFVSILDFLAFFSVGRHAVQ